MNLRTGLSDKTELAAATIPTGQILNLWSLYTASRGFNIDIGLEFVHTIRNISVSKTIQKPICIAPCVANGEKLRSREKDSICKCPQDNILWQ